METFKNHQGKIAEMLGMSLGQGLGSGVNTFFANKALDDVLQDNSMKDAPISTRLGKLQSALSPYGEIGEKLFQNRIGIEQQAEKEKQDKIQSKATLEKEKRLFEHQKDLQTQKDAASLERTQNRPPPGGISGQPIPIDQIEKIENFIKDNPNATANEMSLGLGKAGVNPKYYEPYVENARENEKTAFKTGETKNTALRAETLPLKQELAKKAMAAQHGIQNKEQLINLIKKGDINDPTFAALAQALPLGLGKRLLSDDTVEYKAGLVEEFGDLKNLFPGAIRVKEIEILEEKVADLYFTDAQKESILNSRINALQADIILANVAAEMEEEGKNYPLLTYQKELQKRAKPQMDALYNRVIDEQKSAIKDAENKKKMPLDINNPEDKAIIMQIKKEAGGNYKDAERLAKKKGYHW